MKKENKKFIIFSILIFIYIFSNIMLKGVNDLDELWNFNFAKNISEGLIPYNDFNMIVTPFTYYIPAILFNIFGSELIVMRICAGILNTAIFSVIYLIIGKISEAIRVNKKDEEISKVKSNSVLQIIFTTILVLIFTNMYVIDYNFTGILITLIIIYLEIRDLIKNENIKNLNLKKEFIIGILLGILILTKQSLGIVTCLASLGYTLLIVKNKKELIQYIKATFFKLVAILIQVSIFAIYLILTNSLTSFIDYAILGIQTFSNSIPYTHLFAGDILFKILAIIVPLNLIYMFFKGIKLYKRNERKIENDINLILFAYGIATFTLIYPISDKIHFLVASVISLIGIIYNLYRWINKYISKKISNKNKYAFNVILATVGIAILIGFSILNIIEYCSLPYMSTLNNFKYISISENLEKRIKVVNEYIISQNELGNNVYILDVEASLHMIPLDTYTKDYDMFNKGNLGQAGEQGQIEKIKEAEDNTIYLIKNERYRRNWQNPEEVRKYIIDNLTKTGEISIFDIYVK